MISATSLVLDEFLTQEIRDIGRHCTGQGFMTAHAQPKLHLCFFLVFQTPNHLHIDGCGGVGQDPF